MKLLAILVISIEFLNSARRMLWIVSGEIQETTDDIYGSIGDAASPNEAIYSALSDGEIQASFYVISYSPC